MQGLGKCVSGTTRNTRLKAPRNFSKGKSLLSERESSSGSEESAAVHFVQMDLSDFGDKIKLSDNDPAVVRTVETLAVVESDVSTQTQEKEARASRGIPSR